MCTTEDRKMAKRKIATFTGDRGSVNVYRDSGWNSYEVRPVAVYANSAERELATYFTDCKDDACQTAKHIVNGGQKDA